MPKRAGFPQNFYVEGRDVSGDVGSIESASFKRSLGTITGIDKSAEERIPLLGDGQLTWKAWFNDSTDQGHDAFKNLGDADTGILWALGLAVGDPAAFLTAKRFSYETSRGEDGSLQCSLDAQGTGGTCLEWGRMLTAGKVTHAGAANGASLDNAAPSSSGAVVAIEHFALGSGTVTYLWQDSPDNSVFTTRITFTAISGAATRKSERRTFDGTVARYTRIASSGTFTNAVFAAFERRRLATDLDAA